MARVRDPVSRGDWLGCHLLGQHLRPTGLASCGASEVRARVLGAEQLLGARKQRFADVRREGDFG